MLDNEIFSILERTPLGVGGELQLTDAMRELAVKYGMIGVDFSGIRYDMGNKFGILKANIEVGLSHPEVSSQLKEYIKEIAKVGKDLLIILDVDCLISEEEQKNMEEIVKYQEEARSKTDIERTDTTKEKTGVKIDGISVINPVNNKEVPVYLGDFVLASYGTGAVMAVPSHDQRDFEYAKEHNLEIIQVIDCGDISEHAIEKQDYMGHGYKMMNSEDFDGMTVDEAREKISDMLEEKKLGKRVNNYKMRDWIFSRQRFWGEPIPMINCPKCGWVPEKEENLRLN